METRKKIIIGGLGALTPVIMNLLVVDFQVLLLKITFWATLGYVIRIIILFYLGGLVAFLHKDENTPFKIFELGIVAPALITALLNAANIETPKLPAEAGGNPSGSIISTPLAYGQTTPKEEPKTFSLPEETRTQQIWRGLTGSSPKNVWYVIVGSHLKLEDAERQVQQIAQEKKGFRAEVYAPYGENPYHAVVIGANLTHKQAQQLQQRAIAAGFPKDTYLWTFPK
ncbi:MAG: SPOR domain-containing protein [Candidatus Bathyarchaeota archaeon]|nr:MAG: SPOR domain-containing protein [Candidatus Bathyarchaeota archaeon]